MSIFFDFLIYSARRILTRETNEDKSDKKKSQEEIINDFRKQYKSFDKEQALENLNYGYEIDETFHLQIPAEIRYIARKYDLPEDKWDKIYQDLIAENVDNHIKLLLAQAMKYSTRKSNVYINLEKLLIVLKENQDAKIKSEMIWALGYQLKNSIEKKSEELIDEKLIHEIKSIIQGLENEFNTQSIRFLNEQIQRQGHIDDGSYREKKTPSTNYSKKQPQLIVTKNQLTSKINLRNTQSEELINRLNTVSIFQKSNKKIKINSVTEYLPTILDKDGTDRSCLRATYKEIVHLYNKIKAGCILKRKDKDEYLPLKFIGPKHKWLFTGHSTELLFIDSMIADIFFEISKKQILHDNAIKSLMNCIDSLDGLEEKILGGVNEKKDIAEEIANFNRRKKRTNNAQGSFLESYKNDPDIIANLARQIDDKDCGKIEEIITSEVKRIRLVAISTIYNCAVRNSAILNTDRTKKLEKYLEDEDISFKSYIIKILGNLKDNNNIDYKNLFNNCLKELEKGVNVDSSINYIDQQSKDDKRCDELFNKDVITRISYLFKNSNLNDKTKLYCCEIINNYLERSYSNGLNESQLKNYIYLINDSQNSIELKIEALRSIVMTTIKQQDLPIFVIESLAESINKFADKFDNFVLIALEIVSRKRTIPNVDQLSIKLLNSWVIVGEGTDITFEKSSEDNSDYPVISSIVAQIFINSLQKNVQITDQSLEYLAKALNSKDKQTRILSAKSLYLALETHEIKNDILLELREYVDDRIHDVSVFSTVVYIRGLAKLSTAGEPIMTSHIECLPTIYAFEDLQLDEKNFTDVVNKNILLVLFNEAKNTQLDDNMFHMIDHILLLGNCNQEEVIQILNNYSANKYPLPENTIFALENTVGIPEYSNAVLKVFENIIQNGRAVGDKIPHIIADNLYLSDDDKLRDESFVLLDMINHNQDVSDEIFDILELERASIDPTLFYAICYLDEKTKEGKKLTVNGFRMLNNMLDKEFNEKLLLILLNISNNGQIIPDDIIDKLVERFNPKKVHNQLINIFENLVKNNQNISNELSLKLEEGLDNKSVSDKILLIFVVRGQKGEKLSENIIRKILKKFLTIKNQLMMQQYISVICSIIRLVHLDDKFFGIRSILNSRIQTALIHAVEKGNQVVVSKSVNGFKMLMSVYRVELEKKSINALLNLATNAICDEKIKQEINTLLDHLKLEESQRWRFQLSNLKYASDNQLLDELSKVENTKFLQQDLDQIDRIINKCPDLINKTLNILITCSNKENIPDNLLDSIIDLLARTNTNEIRLLCFQLIGEITKVKRKFSEKAISLIAAQDNEKEVNHLLKLIAKYQSIPKELHNRIKLSLQIDDLTNMNPTHLNNYLKNIREKLDKDLPVSHATVERLLSSQVHEDNSKTDSKIGRQLVDIFALVVIQNPDYSCNQSIVNRLEKAILSKYINNNILKAYQEVIKRKYCQSNNLSTVLDVLVDVSKRSKIDVKLQLDILICIVLASESMTISKMELLEMNYYRKDATIRRWSFRGLRAAYEHGVQSIIFDEWCRDISNDLEKNVHSKVVQDLDLFETMTTIKYVDFTKIHDKQQNQWNRELLIFDLLERFEINEDDKSNFYKTWIAIESHQKFQEGKSNILLKLIHRIQCNNTFSFKQCYDIVKLLSKIDFENAFKILSNSKKPHIDLQKQHLSNLIHQRLSNKEINRKYIDDLALDMISKFDINISETLLCSIENINDLKDFKNVLDFADKNKLTISDIDVQPGTISMLKRSLEKTILGNQIVKINRRKLSASLDTLLDKNWTFEQLNIIFSNLKGSNPHEKTVREGYFINVLEILSQYNILPTPENQNKILLALEKPVESWQREVNIIAIENTFLEVGQVKNAVELIQELTNLNSHDQDLIKLIKNSLNLLEKIKKPDLVSEVLDTSLEYIDDRDENTQLIYIAKWTKKRIQLWADKVKTHTYHRYINSENFIIEALAVIKRANLLDSGFHLTDTQILSCLVILNAGNNKGRLLQVGTGEGKSTIICVLAVIYALKGKNVDIINSTYVFAERDVKDKTKFYSMFNLQCSDNNDKSIYLAGPKACYKKQIVYGEAAQFQFDILRTKYAQLNTLAGREFDVAIVDEVDSMLIDDSSKIARLASTISGMDRLQVIYHLLWHHLISLQERINLENTDEQEESYIKSTSDISHIGQAIPENVEGDAFIKEHLKEYIRRLIREQIKVPKNLVKFVHTQIPKWVDNAIVAFNYEENINYVVHEGLIKPVDYNSTGIVQSFTNWSDGLHQFLQIKHNLKMTSETFTTNFLSNREYFAQYGTNLFGLTGTLGSEKAKQVLSDVYNVDFVIIPSLRQKQYLPLSDIVVNNKTDWLNEIFHSAVNESSKGRGTLIICETIENSKIIAEKFRREYRSSLIKLYTMNNMDQEKNIETVEPGEIIVATNLAGRGTDIKTNEIEKYGGLHVIITFMPPNKRVEEQAFGRTARQGKRGTGQRILNTDNSTPEHVDIQKITQIRDDIEERMLADFQKDELNVIKLKDKLFTEFCSLLDKIRQKIREKESLRTKTKNIIKNIVTHITPSVLEINVLQAIEEQWAMFLRNIDDKKSSIDSEQVYKEYNEFSEKINNDYNNDTIIKNPYCHIVIANDLLIHDFTLKNKYNIAMKHFDQAIELDPDNSAAAFAGKGWLLLKLKNRLTVWDRRELGYKQKSIDAFNKALEILSDERATLTTMEALLRKRCFNFTTALSKQLMQKLNILGNYINSLENAVIAIKQSQRLIEITEIQKLENSNSGILKRIILYNGIEKGSGKWCDIRLISPDHIHYHKTAVKNSETIIVVRDENEFTIKYKLKGKDELAEWIVDNQELVEVLQSLPYDRAILDRDVYPKIYNLIYEKITSNKGQIRGEFLTPLQKLGNDSIYEVTYNDLTVRKDCVTKDQAIDTLNQLVAKSEANWLPIKIARSAITATRNLCRYPNTVLNHDYQHISISISSINGENLKTFLNPDIEIKEVTQEVALAQLKGKGSFLYPHLLAEGSSSDSFRVDLEIIQDNDILESKFALQTREAIEIIKKRKGNDLIFNLTFLSANEISKVLKEKGLFHSNLTVEFIGLNAENIKTKLTQIMSNSIILEISDSREMLLEVISSLKTEHIELYLPTNKEQNNKRITIVVDKVTAAKIIKEVTSNTTTIKLIDINRHTVENIIDICPNANFDISFIEIEINNLLKGIEDESVCIQFDMLRKEAAETLITQIRKEKFDFCLIFKNLTNHQAQRLIEIAPIEQETIEIKKVKSISELFMNESRPNLELSEFAGRGIEYLLEISEKKFIAWTTISIVIALAAVQMIVGGALIASGFGTTFGIGLIIEGIADLATVARAGYTRKFSWSDYGKQKAISLLISTLSMGVSAIKNAGRGVQTLAVGIGEEVVEQSVTRGVTNGKAAGHILVQTGKNVKGFTINQIGLKAGENSLKIINKGVSLGSPFVLEKLKPKLSASIQIKVNNKFCEPSLLKLVRKMYALDAFNKQQQLKIKLNKILAEIINPEHKSCYKHWIVISSSLSECIIPSANKIPGSIHVGIKIIATLNSMHQINIIIENVRDQLIMKLSQVDKETLSVHQILHRHCGVNKQDMKEIVALLQTKGIIDELGITDENEKLDNNVFSEKLRRCDFNQFNNYKEKVVGFLTSLHSNMSNVEFNDFSEIIKLVSDTITEHVIRITESRLIS